MCKASGDQRRQGQTCLSHQISSLRKPTIINVIIADHQPVFRTGLAKLLAAEDDIRIIAQPQSADHLLNALDRLRPNVVILSSGFLPATGDILKFTAFAAERRVAILILTGNTENASHFVPLGVAGVFFRSVSAEMLVEGVRRLARGGSYLQTHLAAAEICPDFVGERVTSKLSRNELKIIAAVLQGCKNREIATRLEISVPMVKKALQTIYDKTGVSDRLELALFVVHHRVLAQAAASEHLIQRRFSGRTAPQKNQSRFSGALTLSFPELAEESGNSPIDASVAGTTLGTTEQPSNCGK